MRPENTHPRRDTGGPGIDKRREPRRAFTERIELCILRSPNGEPPGAMLCHQSRAFNISSGGIGAMVEGHVELGSMVGVRVPTDVVRNEPSMRVGVVRHCRPSEKQGWFFLGVEFIDDSTLTQEARDLFNR